MSKLALTPSSNRPVPRALYHVDRKQWSPCPWHVRVQQVSGGEIRTCTQGSSPGPTSRRQECETPFKQTPGADMERQGWRGPEAARVARLQPMSCFLLMNLHRRVVRYQRCLIQNVLPLLFLFLSPLRFSSSSSLFFHFFVIFRVFLKFIVYLEFPFFTLAFLLSCSFAIVFPLFWKRFGATNVTRHFRMFREHDERLRVCV